MLAKSCLYPVLFIFYTCHCDSGVFSLLRPGQRFRAISQACISAGTLFGSGEGKRNCEDTIFYKHTRARDTWPVYVYVKPALSTHSDFTVAIATIDWPAIGRLKRHLGVFAALGAYGRKHLAREPVAVTTISIPLCLPCLSA